MEILYATLESIAVLFGLGLLGFWIISRRVMPETALDILSPFALDIALPSLIFVSILKGFNPAAHPGWWSLPLWWCGFMAMVGVLTALGSRLAPPHLRREFTMSLLYPNAIFIPLAVLTGLFGAESPRLVDLFLFTLLFPSLFFGSYHLFYGAGKSKLDLSRIFNIVLIATVLAVVLKLSGLHWLLPAFGLQILSMLGATAIPLLMLILGGSAYADFRRGGELYTVECVKFVLLKNIVFPLTALGLLLLIRPPQPVALLIMLESAVPPLSAVPVAISRMGGNRNAANQFLIASFAASLVTIPAAMTLFAVFFN
ncbi:MAG: AEC family transporter [Elusimicrobiota bacterium]